MDGKSGVEATAVARKGENVRASSFGKKERWGVDEKVFHQTMGTGKTIGW